MTAQQVSKEAMAFIHDGRVRNHMLGNAAGEHGGEVELIESQRFRDFLPTKNGCMVFGLVGGDNNVA
ncbi:MAG: hypothetical protein IKG21_12075 [Atopobiaceae bacterium]|nr:hypothetical protein [Atopobiaceae bacterium]